MSDRNLSHDRVAQILGREIPEHKEWAWDYDEIMLDATFAYDELKAIMQAWEEYRSGVNNERHTKLLRS